MSEFPKPPDYELRDPEEALKELDNSFGCDTLAIFTAIRSEVPSLGNLKIEFHPSRLYSEYSDGNTLEHSYISLYPPDSPRYKKHIDDGSAHTRLEPYLWLIIDGNGAIALPKLVNQMFAHEVWHQRRAIERLRRHNGNAAAAYATYLLEQNKMLADLYLGMPSSEADTKLADRDEAFLQHLGVLGLLSEDRSIDPAVWQQARNHNTQDYYRSATEHDADEGALHLITSLGLEKRDNLSAASLPSRR